MSTLKVNTIQDASGNNSSTPAQIANGVAKAWVRFDGTGASSANQTIKSSYNVSTVFKSGTGVYVINFTNAFLDTNYSVTFGGTYLDNNTSQRNYLPTSQSFATGSVSVYVCDGASGSALDAKVVSATIIR